MGFVSSNIMVFEPKESNVSQSSKMTNKSNYHHNDVYIHSAIEKSTAFTKLANQ